MLTSRCHLPSSYSVTETVSTGGDANVGHARSLAGRAGHWFMSNGTPMMGGASLAY
jgi:hypothetical protein